MRRIVQVLPQALLLQAAALTLVLAVALSAGFAVTPAAAGTLHGASASHKLSSKARGASKTSVRSKAVRPARQNLQSQLSKKLPPEGIFGSCQLSTELSVCEQNLQAIHAAGFTVDVQTVNADLPTMSAFAAYADSIGVSIMWEINDPGFWGGAWAGSTAANDFPQFAAACGCTGQVQVLDTMVQWLSSLPATYGYYAADDELLTTSESAGLKQYASEIRAIDPTHMVMIGSNASQGSDYYSTGATIGNEIYPQTTGSLMPYSSYAATWQSVAQSAAQDQRAAQAAGTQSAFILQAFSFGDNLTDGEAVGVCSPSMSQAECASKLPYPSAAAQLELRNEVLEHADPRLILWYSFAESYDQGNRWAGLEQAIEAPYPTTATVARSTRSRPRRRSR
jgi:hypothetical protein